MNYFGIINSMNKLDSNAATFLSTAGITDQAIVQAINNLVKDLKTTGLWSNFIAIYPFVGGTAVTNKYNLVNPAQYNITFNGTWVHASTGSTPNGTNCWGDTGINASTVLTQNNAHLSFYSRTNAAAANRCSIGAIVGTAAPMIGMYLKSASGFGDVRNANNTGTQTAFYTNTDSRGFYINSKTSSAIGGLVIYKNGTSQASNTAAITVNNYPNANITIGSFSSTYSFDNKECAFASVGLGFTSTQASTFNTIMTNFQTAQARNV